MERHPRWCWETGIVQSACDLELCVYLNIDWSKEFRFFSFCLGVKWEPVLYVHLSNLSKASNQVSMVTAELLLSLHCSVKYVLSGEKSYRSRQAENKLQDGEDK